MTFDDDFLRVHFQTGVRTVTCKSIGVEWPPPDKLDILGFPFELVRRSEITDEERAEMTHVMRGAEYVPSESELER